MNRSELLNTFRTMATKVAEKDFSNISEDMAIAQLGIDSLVLLELVNEMEQEFKVRIPDEQLVGIQTVRQLLDLVERRLPAA